MKKLLTALTLSLASFSLSANEVKVGVVNFNQCITDSKLGKQEQASFEAVRKQFINLIEDTDKQIKDLSAKLENPDYLNAITPEAEAEIKQKLNVLNEDMARYNQQYYQVFNQGQYKLAQTIFDSIKTASETVAAKQNLSMIINKEACFFNIPTLDLTSSVIAEMDKNYNHQENPQRDLLSEPKSIEQKK